MSEKYYWLNDDSRLFLERGYLDDGESPESRIRSIARTAEKALNKEGFAKKFEEYMANGWYSLASPIWANFGKKRGLPFHASVLILTTRWNQFCIHRQKLV